MISHRTLRNARFQFKNEGYHRRRRPRSLPALGRRTRIFSCNQCAAFLLIRCSSLLTRAVSRRRGNSGTLKHEPKALPVANLKTTHTHALPHYDHGMGLRNGLKQSVGRRTFEVIQGVTQSEAHVVTKRGPRHVQHAAETWLHERDFPDRRVLEQVVPDPLRRVEEPHAAWVPSVRDGRQQLPGSSTRCGPREKRFENGTVVSVQSWHSPRSVTTKGSRIDVGGGGSVMPRRREAMRPSRVPPY